MWSVLTALLLVGVAVVGAAFWWSTGRRRRRYRRLSERGAAAVRSRTRRQAPDHLDAAETLAAGSAPDTLEEHGQPQPASAPARPQLEIDFEAPAAQEARREGPGAGQVIVLHVEVEPQRRIRGPDLFDAMRTVGMHFGDMQIFHHFGIGALRSERPLFSAADMFEPGRFDPDTIDTLETRGVAMFMQLPAPVEGSVALELMLGTAQRLAEIVGGEVCDAGHHPLDAARIEGLRRQAEGG